MSGQGAVVIIPARMASERLPGKPLADIAGEPLIVHVLRRAEEAAIGPVVVATDSGAIATAVEKAGGRAVLTRRDHASGSDRVHEALGIIDPERRSTIVVNVQGDLPAIPASDIRAALSALDDPVVDIGTLATEIRNPPDADNPNVVKLVGSPAGPQRLRALYFTRARAPFGEGPLFHHIGLYAYRRSALERFVALPRSTLEMRESLEQLRALEAGMRIDALVVDSAPVEVNTEADLKDARARMSAR